MTPNGLTRSRWKPKRRWLQFSLRTLLLAMLAAALGLAFIAREFAKARDRLATIQELSDRRIYVWQYRRTRVGELAERLPPPADKWASNLLGPGIVHGPLRVSAFSIRGDDVPYLVQRLRKFPTLKSISLMRHQLSHESIEQIHRDLPDVNVDVSHVIGYTHD